MKRAFALLALVACWVGLTYAQEVDVTVRHAPYVVSTVSSKSEKAWADCKYCGSKISYERTYKWDVYNRVWRETTARNAIPTVCRKCQGKVRDQEQLNQEEQDLDRQIEYQETKKRIRAKKDYLKELRSSD